ncbi:LacI family DNA-binding transcriptional regulator [Streptomyces asiaticus]
MVAEEGAPHNGRRPRTADVARAAGVSRQLVSLILRDAPGPNAETRARVLEVAARLGYQPNSAAQQLARRRSQVLGVAFNLRHPFHGDMIESMYPTARELGYDLVLAAKIPGQPQTLPLESLLRHQCEALIMLGLNIALKTLREIAGRLPTVVVGRHVANFPGDSIYAADSDGIHQAVRCLAELGHRAVVHVDGGSGAGPNERRNAYRRAMGACGLQDHTVVIHGGLTEDDGKRAGKELLQAPTVPTAVLACNDRCAIGLLDTFARAGIAVPKDISVVGYDDSHIADLAHVNLTTVRQDAQQMGTLAVRAAVRRIAEPQLEPPTEAVTKTMLVLRGTTSEPYTTSHRRNRIQVPGRRARAPCVSHHGSPGALGVTVGAARQWRRSRALRGAGAPQAAHLARAIPPRGGTPRRGKAGP